MQLDGSTLRLAATDLSNHLACRHLTQLDRGVAEGRLKAPAWRDPSLELLRARGMEHEKAYVDFLRARGVQVVVPAADSGVMAPEATAAAMRAGAGAIVQATLVSGHWLGRADLLIRVEEPSSLGAWSYEVTDTKLAQDTRAGTVLQLCLYSDLVAEIQGRPPEWMHVVKPGPGFTPEDFRFNDFHAYYRLVKRRLEGVAAAAPSTSTYPRPVAHCDVCRWWKECDTRRHKDDNLCLVAGIRPLHVTELERQGITTLAQYAVEPEPLREKPARGNREAFGRVHGQARIQLDGRKAGKIVHELLPPEPSLGLSALPSPVVGDLFFDIESDPFAGDAGLEYLLGVAVAGKGTTLSYKAWWAVNAAEEKAALQAFMDLVVATWKKNPGMHVYHFSPYEPAAIKRLVGRHGICEEELDRLLRAEVFVDLLALTRQGLRVSVESYSLKSLEKCYEFARGLELRDAGSALRRVARALELSVPGEITAEERAAVEVYNRDDCLSTAGLRAWLEARRVELEMSTGLIARPPISTGEASESVKERAADIQAAFDQLTRGLPEDREAWGATERARWLLANQLEYFRREDKCAWWEFFRVQALDPEELVDERKAIQGLQFVGVVGGTARAPIHRYTFPVQEASIDEGDELHEARIDGNSVGKVSAFDLAGRTVDITRTGRSADMHPDAVMVNERVNPSPVDRAFLELAVAAAVGGVDGRGSYRAARDLLLRKHPRLKEPAEGPLRKPGEEIVSAAVRLAKSLDNSVLPVQGPPGTGKTYTGARMIVALAAEGKRIGVTAVSHKVIANLLREVKEAAAEAGALLFTIQKVSRPGRDAAEGVAAGMEETTENAVAAKGLSAGRITGASCWFWSREEMVGSVDYLFIDEAGQMSLAFALAACRSAQNVVLLGDPQQLEQPQRGAHPEGAEVAALVHVLGGGKTVADDAGLFLDVTWRLHPSICSFTSELYYESRLHSRPGLERQVIGGPTPFAGSGLFYVPVEHEGNQNSSSEEVDAVCRIVDTLLAPGATWTSSAGVSRPLGRADIVVVAPYNAQVAALSTRLSGVRVGTVDRFQGQEAPAVIYSMTSSSAADAPRGMGFLYSPNRLNVATSRAQSVCILVASRQILEPECGNPDQMRWANGLCRYRELAKEVEI